MVTKEDIVKEVKHLDPNISEKDEGFKVACVLLASLQVGANEAKIAEFLKISPNYVKRIGTKLRENRVWVDNKIHANWFDKKSGGIAFWMDVNIALGYVERVNKSQSPKSDLSVGTEPTEKKE